MHSVNDYVETIKNIYLYFFYISGYTHTHKELQFHPGSNYYYRTQPKTPDS